MIAIHPILAQVEASATTGSTSSIIIVGFAFVMVVLAVLAAITSIIGAVFSRKAAKDALKAAELAQQTARLAQQTEARKASVPPQLAQVSAPEDDSELDPALFAVIAAAVHSVIGERPHRLISIRPGGPGWAQEGRRQIFTSHQTR